MGVGQDLLDQAIHLATYRGANASQTDLRRAVSTAYYALFHLLGEDASKLLRPGSDAAQTGVQRALDHSSMDQSSLRFSNAVWVDWHGAQHTLPTELRQVANAFMDLQDDRLIADYDNHRIWTLSEVEEVLKTARIAFDDWATIRTHPMADNYLLSMLLGKRR